MTVTAWQRQIARVFRVPLWLLTEQGRRLRPMRTAYSRRLRARRRQRRG